MPTSNSAHHILVVANRACPCPALLEAVRKEVDVPVKHVSSEHGAAAA